MQSRLGVGTQASALRYHVEMGEIPTWNCLPVPWELAGALLLRGRGLKTQKSSTLRGGGLETPPTTTITAPSPLFPPAAGFPVSPGRTSLNGSLWECGRQGSECGS